jgi:hypothetical protein
LATTYQKYIKLDMTGLILPSYYVDGRKTGWADGKEGGGWMPEWRSEMMVESDIQMEGRVDRKKAGYE